MHLFLPREQVEYFALRKGKVLTPLCSSRAQIAMFFGFLLLLQAWRPWGVGHGFQQHAEFSQLLGSCWGPWTPGLGSVPRTMNLCGWKRRQLTPGGTPWDDPDSNVTFPG